VPSSTESDNHVIWPPLQFPGDLYASRALFPLGTEQADAVDFLQFPGMNFDLIAPDVQEATSQRLTYPPAEDEVGFTPSFQDQAGLPPDSILLELVSLFFEHFYAIFPCFHRSMFMQQLQDRTLQTEAPLLLYAMCAIAARYHRDPNIKNKCNEWYQQAKFLYDLTPRDPHPALRTIQAAMCILAFGSTIGDFSSAWLFMGKAWRQASALALNRFDSDHQQIYGLPCPRPQTAVEKEEYRRTLWLLFIIDREHSWPTCWPNAIDEKQFKVDIPVSEEIFQAMSPETAHNTLNPTPFTRNMDSLLKTLSNATNPLNMFHYISIAHVLLGRVSEQVNSLHADPDDPLYTEECNDLDSFLVRFRLSLPIQASSVLECPIEARNHVVWLNITLNSMAILLHYRFAKLVDDIGAHKQFALALVGAKNTAQIVKDASRISIDLLLSPHIGPSLYIAACVLVLHWKLSGDESVKPDIDLFGLVFDRYNEVFLYLGLKFKLALEHDIARSRESALDLRERGFRGLLADCSKWSFVKDRASAMGLHIT
jgi:hypothetical protein